MSLGRPGHEIPPQTMSCCNELSRRTALIFLAGVIPTEKASPGRCPVYDPSIAGGSAAATKCVGGLPGQPAAGRNLYLFDRCLRSRGLVDCGKSGCRKSSQGAAVAEHLGIRPH